MNHRDREEIKTKLQAFSPMALKDMFRAFKKLDASLTATIGDDWLEKSTGHSIPHDISSVLAGHLAPDENGVLLSTLV